MAKWRIKGYGNDRRRLFEEDYEKQSAAVRAEFRATLNGLKDQPRIDWVRPAGFDMLSGQFSELGKLRFKVAKVQHRPLGFFGPGSNEFTLLAWATERDGKFDPPNIRETALERMEAIKNGTSFAYDFDFE